MADNLALWNSVEKTDPSQTKAITGKPYRGTSPKPYFLIHEATKTFGPCGIGWGFTIVNERVENSGKEGDKLHIAHVRVWYIWNDKRGEVEHVGQTMFSGTNKNGLYTDEDAPKKSVTDAVIKALSMIGFAGDIFMGRYDDSKYVNEIAEEFRPVSVPSPALPSPADRYFDEESAFINQCESLSVLQAHWEKEKQARIDILSKNHLAALVKVCTSRVNYLKKSEEAA